MRESEPTGALSLPTGRGRYVLLLEVVTGVSFPVRSGATFDLRAGTYAYVGSAAGSGAWPPACRGTCGGRSSPTGTSTTYS